MGTMDRDLAFTAFCSHLLCSVGGDHEEHESHVDSNFSKTKEKKTEQQNPHLYLPSNTHLIVNCS